MCEYHFLTYLEWCYIHDGLRINTAETARHSSILRATPSDSLHLFHLFFADGDSRFRRTWFSSNPNSLWWVSVFLSLSWWNQGKKNNQLEAVSELRFWFHYPISLIFLVIYYVWLIAEVFSGTSTRTPVCLSPSTIITYPGGLPLNLDRVLHLHLMG